MALTRSFTDHPHSVNETYFQHMHSAFGFGTSMLVGGLACLMHGIFPFLFTTTGSRRIASLHDRMIANRRRADSEAMHSVPAE